MQVNPERLAQLDKIVLHSGKHDSFEEGHCALEVAAYLAGETHSDYPKCVCPVIAGVLRAWNDDLPDNETRNRILRPLLPPILGTHIKSDDVLLP